MNDWPHTPDPCEWDPVNGRPAMVTDERHADATVSLGGGLWHLCAKCAALREFDRFPVEQRKALPRGGAMSVVGPKLQLEDDHA